MGFKVEVVVLLVLVELCAQESFLGPVRLLRLALHAVSHVVRRADDVRRSYFVDGLVLMIEELHV